MESRVNFYLFLKSHLFVQQLKYLKWLLSMPSKDQ